MPVSAYTCYASYVYIVVGYPEVCGEQGITTKQPVPLAAMADAVIQLRDLQGRYSELQAACSEKDAELKELRELAEASISLESQDARTAKLIELSKKNRALTLALDKEKQRGSRLHAELQQAQQAAKNGAKQAAVDPTSLEGIARGVVERAAEAAEAANKEAANWKDRYQQQTNKISQLEQKVFTLEIEAKRLTRALVREVGDDVPLAKVLDEASPDWKGRREQISALRHQVQTLKAAQGLAPEPKYDAAARKVMGKVTGARNAELEQLRAELAAVRQDADAAKTKAEGAMSRRKIVEAELSGLKEKMAVVLTKTQNDDRLIAALRAEVLASKRGPLLAAGTSSPGKAGNGAGRPPVEEDDELWHELSTLRRRCTEQRGQLERYESTIQSLNDRLAASSSASGCARCQGGMTSVQTSSRIGTPPSENRRPSSSSSCRQPGVGTAGSTVPDWDVQGSQQRVSQVSETAAAGFSKSPSGPQQALLGRSYSQTQDLAAQQAEVAGSTPVQVREAAAMQQLRVAEVEISRLQELVQLLRDRIVELEDEVQGAQG